MVEPWRADILGLRAHTLLTIGDMQGIVSFPSLHASSAVLATNMARGGRWFLPVLVLNLVMILSVMTEGAHYFVDMLAGVAVTVAAIAAGRSLLAWCERGHAVRPAPLPVLSLAAASTSAVRRL
jgi:membrane-associated phospholipid phosphatase